MKLNKSTNSNWLYVLENIGAVGPVTAQESIFRFLPPVKYFFNIITGGTVMSLTYETEDEAIKSRDALLKEIEKVK